MIWTLIIEIEYSQSHHYTCGDSEYCESSRYLTICFTLWPVQLSTSIEQKNTPNITNFQALSSSALQLPPIIIIPLSPIKPYQAWPKWSISLLFLAHFLAKQPSIAGNDALIQQIRSRSLDDSIRSVQPCSGETMHALKRQSQFTSIRLDRSP